MLFDSKEIARRSLARAEEIRAERKSRKRILQSVMASFGVFVCIGATMFWPDGAKEPYVLIEDDSPPLAFFPGSTSSDLSYRVMVGALDVEMDLPVPAGEPGWINYEIILIETGETIFISGLVAPDSSSGNIRLAQPLAEGEYDAVLIIRAFSPEGRELPDTASVVFTLSAS